MASVPSWETRNHDCASRSTSSTLSASRAAVDRRVMSQAMTACATPSAMNQPPTTRRVRTLCSWVIPPRGSALGAPSTTTTPDTMSASASKAASTATIVTERGRAPGGLELMRTSLSLSPRPGSARLG